jgi:hypothetical protein
MFMGEFPSALITRLPLPVPPGLAEVWGYRGGARFVSFRWEPGGDEIVYDDGRRSGTGDPWAFLAYRRDRAVEAILSAYHLGYSEEEAEFWLILDREDNLLGVATPGAAAEFLGQQHPPRPRLTPEEEARARAELDARVKEMLDLGTWEEMKVSTEALDRSKCERDQALQRMLAFLDRWPGN